MERSRLNRSLWLGLLSAFAFRSSRRSFPNWQPVSLVRVTDYCSVFWSRTDMKPIRINNTLSYHLFGRNCAVACLATIHEVTVDNLFNGTQVVKVSRCPRSRTVPLLYSGYAAPSASSADLHSRPSGSLASLHNTFPPSLEKTRANTDSDYSGR